jgi:hypothetical protein
MFSHVSIGGIEKSGISSRTAVRRPLILVLSLIFVLLLQRSSSGGVDGGVSGSARIAEGRNSSHVETAGLLRHQIGACGVRERFTLRYAGS